MTPQHFFILNFKDNNPQLSFWKLFLTAKQSSGTSSLQKYTIKHVN